MVDIKFDVNEAYNNFTNKHGNKKNADIKRLIMIIETILKNDTVKTALYLGTGIIALKIISDSITECYAIKCEANQENIKEEE